ncbi:MAG: 5-(carboxyamino)imidazole ribonucleotide synthase [Phycisphaerales bacterium]
MRLGILGGGQLARMTALAAAPLGVRVRAYDPSPDACAADVCELIDGPYDDAAALRGFADGLDAVTYEFENVPTIAAETIASRVPIRPGIESLRLSQDRCLEKQALTDAGFEVAPWTPVDSLDSLQKALETIGAPAILKTRRGGYDGKGQAIIADAADAPRAWAAIDEQPAVLEQMLRFDRELSLVVARGIEGDSASYPLVENEHRQGILRVTVAPAVGVSNEINAQAQTMARTLMAALDHRGVLTIEFFEVDGRLVANEFAPRVHNSGHWTIDGAATSQFENHVRAVMGLPLGSTEVRCPTVMLNCVGQLPDVRRVLSRPDSRLHDYRKQQRPGRKVAHVNVCSCTGDRAEELARTLGIDLG